MPLSNILQQIKRKGVIQRPVSSQNNQNNVGLQGRNGSSLSLSSGSTDRPVDPVVARLKAARKAEREKKEAEARAKKGQAPKKESKPRSPSKTAPRANVASRDRPKAAGKLPPMPPPQREKKPKASFSQLMKKASSIDQSKMSIQLKAKTKSPEPLQDRRKAAKPAPSRPNNASQAQKRPPAVRTKSQEPPRQPVVAPRIPIPARRPNAKIEERLKSKKGHASSNRSNRDEYDQYEEDDSDMSSFIASDEEEDVPRDYDREEIWAMFNKGKRRHYDYDDDSDDMEATGAEILEEEARSKKRALEEDRKEMEEEQRLAELKRRRKAGMFQ